MISAAAIVFIIIGVAVILFTFEILPVDITALLVMISLMLTDIISIEEALSGFSNRATLTILALLIISAALQNTGVVAKIGDKMSKIMGSKEIPVLISILVFSAVCSAFINNTAIVAIFLPMILKMSDQKDISATKLLMSLSFGAMLGGSCTLIGSSTNLLVGAIYQDHDLGKIEMFELSPMGGILFGGLVVFMILIGRKTIPRRRPRKQLLTESYKLEDYLTEIYIPEGSPLIGKKLEETQLEKLMNVDVIRIYRDTDTIFLPEDIEVLKEGDELLIKSRADAILKLKTIDGIKLKPEIFEIKDQDLSKKEGVLTEVIISPNSGLVGKNMNEINFRKQFNSIPLGIRRRRKGLSRKSLKLEKLENTALQIGDTLLLETKQQDIDQLYRDENFIVLRKLDERERKPVRGWIASLITLVVILLASFDVLPIITVAWMGCIAMFLTGCIRIQKAYKEVQWNVIFLLAGIIPLGLAMEKSGAGDMISDILINQLGSYGPEVVVSGLFFVTVILTSFVTNAAIAVLLAPIAINIAAQLGLDPKAFVFTIIFAANCSFLTPIGYQTNTLIYTAGRFKFRDFLFTGGMITVLMWILATIFIPYLYF